MQVALTNILLLVKWNIRKLINGSTMSLCSVLFWA
jgi:hypothetical protein